MDLILNVKGMNNFEQWKPKKDQHKKVDKKRFDDDNRNSDDELDKQHKNFKQHIISLQDNFTDTQEKINILQMANETLNNISGSLNDIRSIALENINHLESYDLPAELKTKLENINKLEKIQENIGMILDKDDQNTLSIIEEFKNISDITIKLAKIQGMDQCLGKNIQIEKIIDEVNKTITSVSSTKSNLDQIKVNLMANIKKLSVTLENMVSSHSKIRTVELALQTIEVTQSMILKNATQSICIQIKDTNPSVNDLFQ